MNLPNALTLLRIVLIPVLLTLLVFPDKAISLTAGGVYAVASLTDLFDGYVARKYGTITKSGKLLDPIADKLLISTALIMLISLGRVPAWVVAVIVGREIAVSGLRSMAMSEGIVIPSSLSAKYKTSFQLVAAVCLIVHYEYLTVDFHRAGMIFLWIALVLTLWSGVDYFWKYFTYQTTEEK